MVPLFTYNGVLLTANNALATDANCCCLKCCQNQPSINISFGPDASGQNIYPYGNVSLPFNNFSRNPTECTLVWGVVGVLSLTLIFEVINNIVIVKSITLVDNRIGGHGLTWSYAGNIALDCFKCDISQFIGKFDSWTINPWSARIFNAWHEAQYSRITNIINIGIPTVAPTLANGGLVNLGAFESCISYQFKIQGYHRRAVGPLFNDAEYGQATVGEAIWSIQGGLGAQGIVSPTPTPSPAGNGRRNRVIGPGEDSAPLIYSATSWGAFNTDHLYRGRCVLRQNLQLYSWIDDSFYSDNAVGDPYKISGWRQFPSISL